MKFIKTIFLISLIQLAVEFTLTEESSGNSDSLKKENLRYNELFTEKRKSHLAAVKRIIDLKDSNKQNEMMSVAVKKIFEMLKKSFQKLQEIREENKDTQDDLEFWSDISLVAENTAFVADLALHFPKYFHKLYDRRPEWKMILVSSIDLTQRSQLADRQTQEAIYLMEQELGIKDKTKDFINPYRQKQIQRGNIVFESSDKKNEKKEKRKRAPGLSGSRIDL